MERFYYETRRMTSGWNHGQTVFEVYDRTKPHGDNQVSTCYERRAAEILVAALNASVVQ